jgi:hypothetical protein
MSSSARRGIWPLARRPLPLRTSARAGAEASTSVAETSPHSTAAPVSSRPDLNGPTVSGRFASLELELAELRARNRELEARIVALEARPGLKYMGVWRADAKYSPGDVVTKHGSMWVSKANENRGTPDADGGDGWQLAVRHGQDGRDRRDR